MDVFPSKLPLGIPPLRGIEHRINLVLGASLPNRAAYSANPEETKEIQWQVQDLSNREVGDREATTSMWPDVGVRKGIWIFLEPCGVKTMSVRPRTFTECSKGRCLHLHSPPTPCVPRPLHWGIRPPYPKWVMSHLVLRSNQMLIVCVSRIQVYTHTVQKMDIE
jgi:hypothetical protein